MVFSLRYFIQHIIWYIYDGNVYTSLYIFICMYKSYFNENTEWWISCYPKLELKQHLADLSVLAFHLFSRGIIWLEQMNFSWEQAHGRLFWPYCQSDIPPKQATVLQGYQPDSMWTGARPAAFNIPLDMEVTLGFGTINITHFMCMLQVQIHMIK